MTSPVRRSRHLPTRAVPVGVLVIALAAASCSRRAPADPAAAPVAVVNGEPIRRDTYERELNRAVELPDGAATPTPDQLETIRRTVLQARIDRVLLAQEARTRGLGVTDAEVDERVRRLQADWPGADFQALLAQRQQTAEELRTDARAQLVQERLFHDLVYPRVAVTEEEIRAEVAAHPEEFSEPEQVHAAQIVVKELDQAKDVRARLRNGEKFADVARERSLSADARNGGDLGWFARGVMPPQFDEVAFALSPGQLSEVVTTDYGFHVFKLLERRPARKKDLAEVRGEVERRLLRAKQAQAQEEFLAQLRSRAKITTDPGLVAQVLPRPSPRPAPENAR